MITEVQCAPTLHQHPPRTHSEINWPFRVQEEVVKCAETRRFAVLISGPATAQPLMEGSAVTSPERGRVHVRMCHSTALAGFCKMFKLNIVATKSRDTSYTANSVPQMCDAAALTPTTPSCQAGWPRDDPTGWASPTCAFRSGLRVFPTNRTCVNGLSKRV